MSSVVALVYLGSASLFILGLKRLSSPDTARTGNLMAAVAMLLAVAATLVNQQIVDFTWIVAGMVAGSLIGVVMARTVEMTAMPQMVAVFNGFGGGASGLVAIAEYLSWTQGGALNPGGEVSMMAGTVIAAGLLTGLNSDLPGPVIAQVTQPVHDTVTGRHLLIPQGSRLLGRYDSRVAFGQGRVLVVARGGTTYAVDLRDLVGHELDDGLLPGRLQHVPGPEGDPVRHAEPAGQRLTVLLDDLLLQADEAPPGGTAHRLELFGGEAAGVEVDVGQLVEQHQLRLPVQLLTLVYRRGRFRHVVVEVHGCARGLGGAPCGVAEQGRPDAEGGTRPALELPQDVAVVLQRPDQLVLIGHDLPPEALEHLPGEVAVRLVGAPLADAETEQDAEDDQHALQQEVRPARSGRRFHGRLLLPARRMVHAHVDAAPLDRGRDRVDIALQTAAWVVGHGGRARWVPLTRFHGSKRRATRPAASSPTAPAPSARSVGGIGRRGVAGRVDALHRTGSHEGPEQQPRRDEPLRRRPEAAGRRSYRS